MRVLELFGGYGSQALALENLGIDFTSDLCEIDKYAIKAYNQLHGDTFNWGDICSIDETKLPYYDLITYSSPCQDFSQAGKQAGGEKGSGTRSSLLWECERIIRAVKPKYLLMENVKALTSKKFMPLFQNWLHTLEEIGYQNYWKVLNAKDYGVPQNRERVFVVSILGGGQYQFPEPIPLTRRLKDVLEQNVDEKYYLSDKICERFHYKKVGDDIVGSTLGEECTRSGQRDLVYSTENKMGALSATDYKQPKQILEPLHIKENTQKGYAEAYDGDSVNLEQPNSETRRGRVGHQMANTLTCSCNQGVITHIVPQTVSVRKYNVDIEKLKTVLRLHKETLDLTNKQIAEKLNKPLTNVEHWFRTDDGFSIPEKDVWFSLKELLKIGTDEFDKPITEFEEKDNVYEKANRVYGLDGVSPTLTATSSDEKIVEPRVVQVGNIIETESFGGNPQRGRIYSSDVCSPSLNTCQGGGLEPKVIQEGYFKYPNSDKKHQSNTVISKEGLCTTLDTMSGGNLQPKITEQYRIRKLTPRECWRLMGVKDEQFDKLHDISNTQLYKMAGNSIVVDVLMAIFRNLFLQKEQHG